MARDLVLDDKLWQQVKRQMIKAGAKSVDVGVFGELAIVAAAHEFGTATIPERSWLRATFEEQRDEIQKELGKILGLISNGKLDPSAGLQAAGELIASRARAKITQGDHLEPPLQSATVARKGSSRPLVDTGQLVQSIAAKVR